MNKEPCLGRLAELLMSCRLGDDCADLTWLFLWLLTLLLLALSVSSVSSAADEDTELADAEQTLSFDESRSALVSTLSGLISADCWTDTLDTMVLTWLSVWAARCR